MKNFKPKSLLFVLLICLLVPHFLGTFAAATDATVERVAPSDLVTTDQAYVVLYVGETGEINAEYSSALGQSSIVTWTVENSSVATISSTSGDSNTITGRALGVTSITVSKGNYTTSVPVYVVENECPGTYYIQNMQTDRIMDLEGSSSSDGAAIQQWSYVQGATRQKWIIEASGKYYTIKSARSGKYIGVASTSSGTAVKQYASVTNNTKWIIIRTPNGYQRFVPASCGSTGYSMSVQTGGTANGVDLFIYPYTNDSDKRDEWFFSSGYGNQAYRDETDGNINCHAYAMQISFAPNNWTDRTDAVEDDVTYDKLCDPVQAADLKHRYSIALEQDFEYWLNNTWKPLTGGSWEKETDFTGNGENRLLKPNQYRVVLRGALKIPDGKEYFDTGYHFWYQTKDGRWANKHGICYSELLSFGTTPSTIGTSGWRFSEIDNFYNCDISYYIITLN